MQKRYCQEGILVLLAQSNTHFAMALQKYRLKDMFGLVPTKDYAIS